MTSTVASSKRGRTGNWEAEFYKNGYPKEIIVIEDTPPPQQAADHPHMAYSIIPAPAPPPITNTAAHGQRHKRTRTDSQRQGASNHTTSDLSVTRKRRKMYTQLVPPQHYSVNGFYPSHTTQLPPPMPTDTSCDDKDGHYIVRPGSFLTERYQVDKQLGQGTFGKVVMCRDLVRRTTCAIKIIRAVQKYKDASQIEIRVLSTIKEHDPLNFNKCIHMMEWFEYRNHVCMVFELLGESVFDFLKKNDYTPFPPHHIQQFAKQLLTSVTFLHQLKLIHTDLKPENILLVDHSGTDVPARTQRGKTRILNNTDIQLIDFGSATFEDDYHSAVVSTRHYRAPEIILGLGWSFPCDIWSVGCILVEFYTGEALFQTRENLEHLAMMQAVLGRIPPRLVQMASREAQKYFKGGQLAYPDATTTPQSQSYVAKLKPLKNIILPTTPMSLAFIDLVQKMLTYDPAMRITAREALRHPFFQVDYDAFGQVVKNS